MKILIVQTAFIGDVVLSLSLVGAVKKYIPEVQVDFLTIPSSKNIVETHPEIDQLWIFDKRGTHKGIRALFKYAAKIKQENYELAIVPHRSIRSAILTWLARIPQRIGFDKSAGRFFFTTLIKYRPDLHEIDRNLTLLNSFNIPLKPSIYPEIELTEGDIATVSNWMASKGIPPKTKFLVFAPGSVWPTKRWPIKYWNQLAKLAIHAGFPVVFIGSKADARLFQNDLTWKDGQMNAMGEFSLRESSVLIQKSQLLVSNDSSPTHLAVATGSRVLTIYGPTSPDFGFYPYGSPTNIVQRENLDCRPCAIHGGNECPQGHFKCMLSLSAEAVFQKIREILNDNPD